MKRTIVTMPNTYSDHKIDCSSQEYYYANI